MMIIMMMTVCHKLLIFASIQCVIWRLTWGLHNRLNRQLDLMWGVSTSTSIVLMVCYCCLSITRLVARFSI